MTVVELFTCIFIQLLAMADVIIIKIIVKAYLSLSVLLNLFFETLDFFIEKNFLGFLDKKKYKHH